MKRVGLSIIILMLIMSSCWLIPDEPLMPDEDNGLVTIRIANRRYQQAQYQPSAIPADTETIGLHIAGINPAIVQAKSFDGKEYIEFQVLLPAPRTYYFYIIGANNRKILTCYGMEKEVLIEPGVTNTLVIEMQTYEVEFFAMPTGKTFSLDEPKYSDDEPKEVIWANFEATLEFFGDYIGEFYTHFYNQSPYYPRLYKEYTLDTWNNKSFWRVESGWSDSPEEHGWYYLISHNDNKIYVKRLFYLNGFDFAVPINYADSGEPYQFDKGELYLSVPIKWGAFGGMEAGFELPTPVNLKDLLGETAIIVQ